VRRYGIMGCKINWISHLMLEVSFSNQKIYRRKVNLYFGDF
jgi:hypothetical protein